MQKVDWIIVGVGVVALVATTLGVLYEDELMGEQEVTFVGAERTLNIAPGTPFANGGGFTLAPGHNVTGAAFDVTVDFAGTAVNPDGPASIRVTVFGPDGAQVGQQTKEMAFTGTPGSITGSAVSFAFDGDFMGVTVPANTTTDDKDGFDMSYVWADDADYRVEVTVTPPGDTIGTLTGGADYSFTVSAVITERYFMHSFPAPQLEGGA